MGKAAAHQEAIQIDGQRCRFEMPSNRPFEIYKSNYAPGHGGDIALHSVFLQLRQVFNIRRALYPGSYLHITPSLFFPHVTYVDCLAGIDNMLADSNLRDYIERHKVYPEQAEIRCYQQDYQTFNSPPPESFDLLISLNAGLISQIFGRFLAPGGLLLANDEHYDARRAFVDQDYSLAGVFEENSCRMVAAPPELSTYFRTSTGVALVPEMVDSDLGRSPSRARFKPAKSAKAFLFRKRG